MSNKPFSQWSRKEKRAATLVWQGKRIKVLAFITKMHLYLSSKYKTTDKDTRKPVNHYEQMLDLYMTHGAGELQAYLKMFNDASIQQKAELDAWKAEGETSEDLYKDAKEFTEKLNNEKAAGH